MKIHSNKILKDYFNNKPGIPEQAIARLATTSLCCKQIFHKLLLKPLSRNSLKLMSSEGLCTLVFLFHTTTPVSTRTGIPVILMTDCGLSRVNIRKIDRKTHWGEGFQLQLQDNFRPAEKRLVFAKCWGWYCSAQQAVNLKQKKAFGRDWTYASNSKIWHNKYEKKSHHPGKQHSVSTLIF